LLRFEQPLQEVAVATAQQQVQQLRRELAASGADPFELAAMAIQRAEAYRQQLEALTTTAPVVWMRPPTADFCLRTPA
jgi:hypothetical protein